MKNLEWEDLAKFKKTYNPCDECPYGIEARDGSGNDSMCKICEFRALLNHTTPANPPLTLEQLREMDGEPVWIRKKEHPPSKKWNDGAYFILHESEWAKILGDFEEYFSLEGKCFVDDYGKTWLAYAHKPEKEDAK